MDTKNQSTEERILSIALEMFSVRGYSSVSIRDISSAVGIKESSIYYYFTNKRAIFDTLLLRAQELMLSKKTFFDKALLNTNEISPESFVYAGIAYIESFMLEDKIYKLINMLTIEKSTNAEASRFYTTLLFNTPLEHHQQVFSMLIQKQLLADGDPASLASEYQAIIIYIFFKYFPSLDCITEESKAAARAELSNMLKRFYSHYFVRS